MEVFSTLDPCMWQWHCTTFSIFAFDVTDPMLYRCVTVLLHTDWRIAITFYFFAFYFFIVFCVTAVLWAVPEIKMD